MKVDRDSSRLIFVLFINAVYKLFVFLFYSVSFNLLAFFIGRKVSSSLDSSSSSSWTSSWNSSWTSSWISSWTSSWTSRWTSSWTSS